MNKNIINCIIDFHKLTIHKIICENYYVSILHTYSSQKTRYIVYRAVIYDKLDLIPNIIDKNGYIEKYIKDAFNRKCQDKLFISNIRKKIYKCHHKSNNSENYAHYCDADCCYFILLKFFENAKNLNNFLHENTLYEATWEYFRFNRENSGNIQNSEKIIEILITNKIGINYARGSYHQTALKILIESGYLSKKLLKLFLENGVIIDGYLQTLINHKFFYSEHDYQDLYDLLSQKIE